VAAAAQWLCQQLCCHCPCLVVVVQEQMCKQIETHPLRRITPDPYTPALSMPNR
jgi:hypothetical protein